MSLLRKVSLVGMAVAVILSRAPMPVAAGDALRQAESARVRFVHAAVDAPQLDAYVDGTLLASGVREFTSYFDIPAGEHTLSFRAEGSAVDSAVITTRLEEGEHLTVAALNTLAALDALAIPDDVSAPARNAARVTLVHAAPDAPPIAAQLGDVPLADNLEYGMVSEPVQVLAGSLNFVLTTPDGAPLAAQPAQTIAAGRTYTAFVIGTTTPDTIRVFVVESAAQEPDPSTQFRFANMTHATDTLRVYVNREPAPIFPQVPFGSITNYFATGQGSHLVEVYRLDAGPESGPPLATVTADIGPDESVIFVAQGTAEHLEIAAYTSDLGPLPPASARLQIVNLAAGHPELQVARVEGDILFDRIGQYQQASRVIPAGNYSLRFTNPASGSVIMEQNGIGLLAGTVTTLFVIEDDPANPWVNAIPLTVENVPQIASVRWAHLHLAGPAVDITVDGEPVVTGLAYKTVTDFQLIEPGMLALAAYPAGSDPATTEPLASLSVELTGATFPRTIYLYGTADSMQFGVAPDSLELLPAGRARVRFINTAIDSGSVAVINPTDGSRVVPDLHFGLSSANATIDAGVYTFNFVREEGPIAALQGVPLEAGVNYTIVLAGVYLEEPGLEVIVLEARPW